VNWTSWLLSGFLATLALSTLLSASQGCGFTRMNLPYLIGTFVTPQREKAKVYGFMIHLVERLVFFYPVRARVRGAAHGELVVWRTFGTGARAVHFDGWNVVDARDPPTNGERTARSQREPST
jgi:hypothetical protein